MPNQTVTIEIDAPDGYELTGEYRYLQSGEVYLGEYGVRTWEADRRSQYQYFILRKIEPEKPQLRCFEIDWTADLWPVSYTHLTLPTN